MFISAMNLKEIPDNWSKVYITSIYKKERGNNTKNIGPLMSYHLWAGNMEQY